MNKEDLENTEALLGMSNLASKLAYNSSLHDVSCFYLVLHSIDYEGIQKEMYLFNDLEKAKDKLDELKIKIRGWEDERYYIKEINCN